ncbi:MAG TPA: GGDEF domain-containing protein, partial [Pseudothermotoga sp.]
LDLSKFKDVNDKYGHVVGDEVLKIIAERLKEVVRQNDLVARFGGDEFLIMTYDVYSKNMSSLLNRIIHTIEKPIEIYDKTFRLSVQIGVAIFPQDGESLDELIRVADFAMYRAKQKRISIVFYKDEKD